jgi:hypothetical protein
MLAIAGNQTVIGLMAPVLQAIGWIRAKHGNFTNSVIAFVSVGLERLVLHIMIKLLPALALHTGGLCRFAGLYQAFDMNLRPHCDNAENCRESMAGKMAAEHTMNMFELSNCS